MTEWPVELGDVGDVFPAPKTPIPPGERVPLLRSDIRPVKAYHFLCPCCGNWWFVPTRGNNIDGPEWDAEETDDKLTLNPSLVCTIGGGHFWLHDGVLRDV